MANHVDKVADVNPSKENRRLQVRVVCLWNIPSYGVSSLPYSQEMVLLDVSGGKIHASVRKTLVFKFFNQLKEGEAYEIINFGVGRNVGNYKTTHHEFKLNFDIATTIRRLREFPIPIHGFTFIDMKDLSRNDFDPSYLVDVIGILSGVGTERDYEDKDGKPCRFNVIELQAKG